MSPAPSLNVRLWATPEILLGEADLTIRGAVQNTGAVPVDAQVHASHLLVDGQPCAAWDWAISNGYRDAREFDLPPGEQVEFARRLPASEVVPQPGQHVLILEVRGVQSPAVTVARSIPGVSGIENV